VSGPTRAGAPRFLAARRPRCSRRREYRKHVTNAQERNAVLAQRSFCATERTRRAGDPPVRALSPLGIADRPAWCRIAAPAGWRDQLPAARHPSTPPWPPAQPAPNARRAVPRPVAAAAPAEAELPAAARPPAWRPGAGPRACRCTLGTTRPSTVVRPGPATDGASAIPSVVPGECAASRRSVRRRAGATGPSAASGPTTVSVRAGTSTATGSLAAARGRRARTTCPTDSPPASLRARLPARLPAPPRAPTSSPLRHPAADLAPAVPPLRRVSARPAA
jgi:hypothetical protein